MKLSNLFEEDEEELPEKTRKKIAKLFPKAWTVDTKTRNKVEARYHSTLIRKLILMT